MNNYFEAAFVQATCSKAKIGSYANTGGDFLSRSNRASGQIGSIGNEFTVIDDGQNQLSCNFSNKQFSRLGDLLTEQSRLSYSLERAKNELSEYSWLISVT